MPERFRQKHPALREGFVATDDQRSMSRSSNQRKYFPALLADGQEIVTEISIARLSVKTHDRPVFLAVILDRSHEVELERKLKERANVDALTKLSSRAHFIEQATSEFTRARRYGRPLSMIFFDIDHFKKVNDQHGHHVGDLLLERVGQVCLETVRTADICGRLGGEEFAVLTPETTLEDASKLAERLRMSISEIRALGDVPITVTASFGVTEILADDEGLNAGYKRADRALYRSKNQGRNQVSLSVT